ncbi:hypothetical protein PFISCL1PPCAC_8747, partial [Pristionchus fissidentatus]
LSLEPMIRAALAANPGYSTQGHKIVPDGEMYKHLGVPTGTTTFPSGAKAIERMTLHLEKIDKSLLAPWQKFDALRSFIMPQVSFHLLHGMVPKKPLVALDKMVKRVSKKWLGVPRRASNEILYMDTSKGGQSLLPLSILADISTVSHAVSLLHSIDTTVAAHAHRAAGEVASTRAKKKVSNDELAEYLSGSTEGIYRTPTTDIPSLWTAARSATRGQSLLPLSILADISTVSHAVSLLHSIDTTVAAHAHRAAGEVASTRAKKKVSNDELAEYLSGSTEGIYRTPTTDIPSLWTAARSATRRLSSHLPVSWYHGTTGGLFASLGGSPLSPRNTQRALTASLRARYHRSLLAKPDQGSSYRTPHLDYESNYWVRNGDFLRFCDWRFVHRARLNLLPLNDVHIPYDNGRESIELASERKRAKYKKVVEHYESEGYNVKFVDFCVTALGRVGGGSIEALRALKISSYYSRLMLKLAVSDVIKGSRNVYALHITGQVM